MTSNTKNLIKLAGLFIVAACMVHAPYAAALPAEQATTETPTAPDGENNSQTALERPQADENGYYPGANIYVSDRAYVWLRSGPGTQYKITGSVHPGDSVSFKRYSQDKRFIEVQHGNGSYWMQAHDLQAEPCGKAKEAILQEQINALQNKLENYDNELSRDYKNIKARLEKLENENSGLKKAVADKDTTIQELDETRRKYADKLETKELDMQMRWWLQGAMIATGGAFIGILLVFIPRPNRKKREIRF